MDAYFECVQHAASSLGYTLTYQCSDWYEEVYALVEAPAVQLIYTPASLYSLGFYARERRCAFTHALPHTGDPARMNAAEVIKTGAAVGKSYAAWGEIFGKANERWKAKHGLIENTQGSLNV